MGFSQGGLIARYIAEACNFKGKVRNLLTVGTPNMGYIDPPKCQDLANLILSYVVNSGDITEDWIHRGLQKFICSTGNWIFDTLVYFPFSYNILQKFVAPSDYVRLPEEMSLY